jgi:hypothetical protein
MKQFIKIYFDILLFTIHLSPQILIQPFLGYSFDANLSKLNTLHFHQLRFW